MQEAPQRAQRPSLALGLALPCLLVIACDGGSRDPNRADAGFDPDSAIPAPPYERQPTVPIPPAPPPLDLAGFPTDEQGSPILASSSNYYLVPREPDPLTALADCTAMVLRCVDRRLQGHSLDACVVSTPACQTDLPWTEPTCCPAACVEAYERHRIAGAAPIQAFRAAFHARPRCMPGLDALVGDAP